MAKEAFIAMAVAVCFMLFHFNFELSVIYFLVLIFIRQEQR